MRLDVRKSLTLGDAKQMTPTVNLMNPQWRQSFRAALQKLGGEFPQVDVKAPTAVTKAVQEESALDAARVGVRHAPSATQIKSEPDAARFVRQRGRAAGRVGEEAPASVWAGPNMERGYQAGTVVGHGGNFVAALTHGSKSPKVQLLNILSNFVAPVAAQAAAPSFANHVTTGDQRSVAPQYRAAALIAAAERARLEGRGYNSDELGKFYAGDLPFYDAYREAPTSPSAAVQNAYVTPEMGASMAIGATKASLAAKGNLLRRALSGMPYAGTATMGALSPIASLSSYYRARHDNAKIDEENAVRKQQGLPLREKVEVPSLDPVSMAADAGSMAAMPLMAHLGAKAPAVLAGTRAAAQMAARGTAAAAGMAALPATLALNAGEGAKQLWQSGALLGEGDPEIANQARRDTAGQNPGFGTVAFRTLMGDPVGAATAWDAGDPNSEVSIAAQREAADAQRGVKQFVSSDGRETQVPYDRFKQHEQIRQAFVAAPSVPKSLLAELVAKDQMQYDALKYQAKRPFTKLTPEQAAPQAMAIAQGISSAWGIPLTQQAVHEITGLVMTLGPEAAKRALVPTKGDRLNNVRLQAVLNEGWLPKDPYLQRTAIYNSFYR